VTDPQHNNLLDRYLRLIELSNDLASTLNLEVLLDRIVQAAADLCTAEAASILLYDESNYQLYFQSATNLETPMMRGLSVPVETSIAGWIITQRLPVIINDAQQDPRHFKQVGETTKIQTDMLLGVPMITKDKVVGVLEAINKRTGPFTVEDQELLLALGSQAAVAIENARLFQQFDLISELVHELRTPLTSLNAAVALLQRNSLPEEKRKTFLKTMQQEITRLSEMATGYLDVARIESGRSPYHVRLVDLVEVVQECVQVMEGKVQERELTLHWTPTQGPLTVRGDQDKLKQVVLNLLNNAIKYTLPGGAVQVKAEYRQGEALILVIDSGVGIPPESLPLLFEKFYRVPDSELTAQGSGLGLFLCKRIITAHQGTIEVDSRVGEGSTFTIRLPASQST